MPFNRSFHSEQSLSLRQSISKYLLYAYTFLMGRPRLAKINKFLLEAVLRSLGYLNYEDHYLSGEYGICKRLFPGSHSSSDLTILDVGANKGGYSAMLMKAIQSSSLSLHCFEPAGHYYDILETRFKGCPRVKLHNVALSNHEGNMQLYDYKGQSTSHASLNPHVFSEIYDSSSSSITVSVVRGDTLCAAHAISHVDLLKIDVEGFEYEVLQGFSRMITEGRIRVIQFEFNQTSIPSRRFISDFRPLLPDFNFFRLLPRGGLVPISPGDSTFHIFQNIICIHSKACQ